MTSALQPPLALPDPLDQVPPPEPMASSNLLTSMIEQTGPRKLQINPVSVFSQQLWRETEEVCACLRVLTLELNPHALPNTLTEENIGR